MSRSADFWWYDMRISLKNGSLTAEIETFGAELKSIRNEDTGIEYLWQGDPAVWADSAPFLFPVVARQLDDSYLLDGREYTMPMHGFAKAREFTVTNRSENSVAMTFCEDAETLGWYPFRFRVTSVFTLTDSTLTVQRRIENRSDAVMPYSMGEHPGYNVPLTPNERAEDYRLIFSSEENAERWYLDDEIICGSEPGLSGRELPVTRTMFDRGALIFKGLKSESVTLCSKTGPHGLTVDLRDFGFLGIWAKPAAPYVCIEPWNGLASSAWSSRELLQKEAIRLLAPGKEEQFTMTLTVF